MTLRPDHSTPTALVTGGSRGLGRALVADLAASGWHVITDGRDAAALAIVHSDRSVRAIPGDVADPAHRRELAAAIEAAGRLDLLVHNASLLGPSPLPALADHPLDAYEELLRANVVAPLALTQLLLPVLRGSGGRIVAVSSDAAVEAYAGWGAYGSSKAALDQLAAVLAAEEPALRVYAFDPGDMRTDMHQRAFPGEDISDRPEPETVVPALRRLVDEDLPSGRYRAAALLPAGAPA
jgi:NAD(P)-dependent dehydrogenase (short-subunit alcohol dehydrogenase family)